ncbi:MAG: hypothetical protein ABS54_15170 [Hyphomicrobium sp. SCN 65-11]|nr:MAG: hypothetical protein ABS54_15170 [Hyphomicrobium sp. SCN 65-11]
MAGESLALGAGSLAIRGTFQFQCEAPYERHRTAAVKPARPDAYQQSAKSAECRLPSREIAA